MHVHLVNPAFPDSFWSFRQCGLVSRMRFGHPVVSLPTVAALTPPDVEVTICDENVEAVDLDWPCDVVGLTAMNVQVERAVELATAFRKRGRTVVIGGPYATLCPEKMRPHADVLFLGEAEHTWPRFIEEWRQGRHRAVYEQADKIDLRQSPAPRFELLKLDRYAGGTLQTSRGCPFDCEFCDIVLESMSGRKVRSKSPVQVVREAEALARLGVDGVFITDDNFTGHRKHAKAILRALAEWGHANGHPIVFNCELSLDVADDEALCQLLRDANFSKIYVGIETPRAASLQETGKKQNLRGDLLRAVRKLQSHGLIVWAGMIVGFDHDDADVFQEQYDFLQEAGIPVTTAGPLIALPGTRLHQRLEKEGRLTSSSHASGVDPIHVTEGTNVLPKQMSSQELETGVNWLVRALYRYDSFAERVIQAIDHGAGTSVGDNRKAPPWREWADLGRLIRACVLGGDLRRARLLWRVTLHALRHRPNAVQAAITHAAYHLHYYDYVSRAFGDPHGVETNCPLSRAPRQSQPEPVRQQADSSRAA